MKASGDAGGSVNTRLLFFASSIGLGLALAVSSPAEAPMIPPTVARISPAGMQRGTTASFIIEGRSLSDASAIIFDAPGLSAKVSEITDVPEKITGPRAGVDLGAQVPQGKKQTAKLDITVAKDATPGLHRFRVKTPLGTSNLVVLAVGALPEIKTPATMEMDAGAPPQTVQLPATLIGAITKTGEKRTYRFAGKAGEEIVFSVTASALGSKLAFHAGVERQRRANACDVGPKRKHARRGTGFQVAQERGLHDFDRRPGSRRRRGLFLSSGWRRSALCVGRVSPGSSRRKGCAGIASRTQPGRASRGRVLFHRRMPMAGPPCRST